MTQNLFNIFRRRLVDLWPQPARKTVRWSKEKSAWNAAARKVIISCRVLKLKMLLFTVASNLGLVQCDSTSPFALGHLNRLAQIVKAKVNLR